MACTQLLLMGMKSHSFLMWSGRPCIGGAQPADGRQIPLCAVAMVRRPDDVLGRSNHLEVEQRGVARSHAPREARLESTASS